MRLKGTGTGALLALALTACGGGDGGSGPPTPAPTATPTPTPSETAASDQAAVQAALTIDLANLPNYAAPLLPAHYDGTLAALDNTPANNPVTNAAATLGRVLFYDRALSTNDTVSCASCHRQALGFADDKRFSIGSTGSAFINAHGMRLGNLRYFQPGTMFWDRRAATVEAQASVPILNPVEMGWQDQGGFAALVAKLGTKPYYPVLFRRAFGDAAISEARIQRALGQFQRAMISSDSKWDRAYAQVFAPAAPNRGLDQPLPGFTASEQRGRELFMNAPGPGGGAGCAACHVPPTFTLAASSRGNGLDADETRLFKAASLKNVGRSAFFMHDGRFLSLSQVVNFYSTGIQDSAVLDNRLRQGGAAGGAPLRLNLSVEDRQALVDFMLTLNDETLAADPKFSDPFR
ncbi:cytochrome-c peroxidase [Tsuneonella sp. HG222]